MGEIKKGVWAAAAIALGACLVAVGSSVRDRVDLGLSGAHGNSMRLDSLVASKDQGAEVPEGAFFREMVDLLKDEYIDPITDEGKLAEGAVRGMVQSLDDAECLYLEQDEFAAYKKASRGLYEGVGIELELIESEPESKEDRDLLGPFRIPRLVVGFVAPGGPADLAGVKTGDWIESIDGQWVVNAREIIRYRRAQRQFADGKMPEEQFRKVRSDVQAKSEHSLLPLKARKRVTCGTTGELEIGWNRGDQQRTTKLKRSETKVAPVETRGDATALRFIEGAAAALKEAMAGKTEMTIDLRSGPAGDYGSMRECLVAIASEGVYGVVANSLGDTVQKLVVAAGNPRPPKLRILVDGGTRDAAEIFALALSSHGQAALSGGKMAGTPHVVEAHSVPTGGGYTLVTGEYRREAAREGKS